MAHSCNGEAYHPHLDATEFDVWVAKAENIVNDLSFPATILMENGGSVHLVFSDNPIYTLRFDSLGGEYPGRVLMELQQGDCLTLLADGTITATAEGTYVFSQGEHPDGGEIVYEAIARDCAETLVMPEPLARLFQSNAPFAVNVSAAGIEISSSTTTATFFR